MAICVFLKMMSLDEAYLNVTEHCRTSGLSPLQIAKQIQEKVLEYAAHFENILLTLHCIQLIHAHMHATQKHTELKRTRANMGTH